MLCRKCRFILAAVVVATLALPAAARSSSDLDSEIESLRADIKSDKVAIITDTMNFTPQESAAFWPIYKNYEYDLSLINDDRLKLIKSYTDKFMTMTDDDAKDLSNKAFDLESRRVDLKKKYFKIFSQKMPTTTVAKFFQLEHRLDMLIDLKIASELPSLLVKPSSTQSTVAK